MILHLLSVKPAMERVAYVLTNHDTESFPQQEVRYVFDPKILPIP